MAVAVELVVRLIHAKGISDADILICSDNQGIIGAFQKGRSANFQSIYALDDPRSYYVNVMCLSSSFM